MPMAKPKTDAKTIRMTGEDFQRTKQLKASCGLGMQELYRQLLRRGEPYVAAWSWFESGVLTRYPELQEEMRQLLEREMRLRVDLGEFARSIARRMAESEDAYEQFEAELKKQDGIAKSQRVECGRKCCRTNPPEDPPPELEDEGAPGGGGGGAG